MNIVTLLFVYMLLWATMNCHIRRHEEKFRKKHKKEDTV